MSLSDSITEKNKQLIRRLMEEMDKGNLYAVDEVYAADYVDHNPSQIREMLPGIEGIKHAFKLLYAAFPDTAHKIEDIVAEGDKVVARISATATHTGEIFGVKPAGKKVELRSIVIYRIIDGKIVERWVAQQGPGVLQQIGATVPTSGSFEHRAASSTF
jgi:predicted ester cyclase